MTLHLPLRQLTLCFIALAAATACGSDDDGGGVNHEASCDKACNRALECNSSTDVQTCAADCKNATAAVGPKLSSSFLTGIDACVAELTCPEIIAAAVYETCQREAAARLAPSAAATSLCDAVVASVMECSGISVGTAGCLNGVKIFSDGALTSAQSCQDKPCDQRGPCLSAELGIDPTATGP